MYIIFTELGWRRIQINYLIGQLFNKGLFTGHLVLYPEPVVMPVAALLVTTLRLLLDVRAVHTRRHHRVVGEAGLVPVSDLPSLR